MNSTFTGKGDMVKVPRMYMGVEQLMEEMSELRAADSDVSCGSRGKMTVEGEERAAWILAGGDERRCREHEGLQLLERN